MILPPSVATRAALSAAFVALGLAATSSALTAQQGVLHGRVVDSSGAPIKDADVGIVALKRLTRTDGEGRFSFGRLPPGDLEVSVRRLTYQPKAVPVTVVLGAHDTLRVTLLAHPLLLAEVTVASTELRRREMIEDFHRRRVRGVGQYVTREEIERRAGGTPSDMLRGLGGLRFIKVGSGRGVRFPSTSIRPRDCPPLIWIDGQKAPGMEVDDIPLNDIEGMEIYNGPATTPLQFSQGVSENTCGTIVVWTRPPPIASRR